MARLLDAPPLALDRARPAPRRPRSALCGVWLGATAWALACGGAPPAETSPAAESRSSWDEAEEEPADDAPLEAAGPDCSDGTCFVCGAGSCPLGAYCDEGSGACAWLTECAGTPSCACLTKILGDGCSCEESGGGPHLRCSR